MTLLVAWVFFPLIAVALALGCGFLLEQFAGRPLPGALLAPAGFAVEIVVASLTTMWPWLAHATVPVVVALAVVGLGLGVRKRRLEWPAVAAALGVFAVYAAPIVLSGSATFAGYITLDDTATWLALADNAMAHGRSLSGLPPSTYSTVLHDYLSTGYPLGAFLPLGIGHALTRQDEAWLFQPQIAFATSMLSLVLYSLAGPLLRSRALRAGVAFLGAQAALLYGYAFWSGIKEVTAAVLVTLAVGLAATLQRGDVKPREMVPLAVAGAAILDTLSIVGSVWFGVFGLVVLFLLSRRAQVRTTALALAVLVPLAAVLALPALTQARAFVSSADSGDLTSSGQAGLGNLVHPLSYLQVFGIWPSGDFRLRPISMLITYVLLAVLIAAGVAGLAFAYRWGRFGMPLLLAVAGGGAFSVVFLGSIGHGSPWLDGKALATASPAFVACAAAGCAVMFEHHRLELVGAVAGLLVATGVLWSNALAYDNVWLAPRSQLTELQTIGKLFAGDGPTLMTEYEPYGVRHFLRDMDPEGASERRYRPDYLRDGAMLGKAQYADLDDFQLSTILAYRTLVLRGSPTESRPPSNYQLVWTGAYYEVWQQSPSAPKILDHLSLGDDDEPDGTASCAGVRALASLARANGGDLVASERPDPVIVDLGASSTHPPRWGVTADGELLPTGNGLVTVTADVPRAGSYQVWLGGSFRDKVKIEVDGVSAGTRTAQFSETDQSVPFGTVQLQKGVHTVTITYLRNRLHPGEGSSPFGLGPLELGQPAADAHLEYVQPADATSLCGKSLDWIEALSGR